VRSTLRGVVMYKFMIVLCFLSAGCSEVCGNALLEAGEACDDANLTNADGCEANCTLPACQNGIVDPGEVCFFAPVEIETDFGPQQIVAADLNRDGVLDLVTANTGFSLSVLLGDGFGGFSRLPDVELAQVTFFVAVGDLDEDGILDLAASLPVLNRVEVFRGIGDGSFAPLVTLPVIDPDSLVIDDFNSDELPDLASTSDTGVEIFLNNGEGGFLSPRFSSSPSRLFDLQTADFNNDGSLDLVAIEDNQDTFLLLLGDGAGNFAAQTSQSAGKGPVALLVEDFSGDNVFDLVVGRLFSSEVGLLIGEELGIFSEVQTIEIRSPSALVAGDINSDSILDVAVSSGLDQENVAHLAVSLGDGTGSFDSPLLFSAGLADPRGLVLADFNEDGALDAALAEQGLGRVLVFLSEP
jgi:cysteine-rich repeat protein